jgi:hypothetical protein
MKSMTPHGITGLERVKGEMSIYLTNGYLEAMACVIIYKKLNIKVLYN